MELPTICIVKAEARTDANLVWDAMGRGPDTFIRRLAPGSPDVNSEPTHYLMQDMSATASDAAEWQALCNGDLPLIQGIWGEDGVIGAAAAQAACSNGNLHVYTAAGPMTPTQRDEWRDGILAGRDLAFIPDDL